jgi:hypothetical protein
MASFGSTLWFRVAMTPRAMRALMMSRDLTSGIFSPSSLTVTPSERVVSRIGPV